MGAEIWSYTVITPHNFRQQNNWNEECAETEGCEPSITGLFVDMYWYGGEKVKPSSPEAAGMQNPFDDSMMTIYYNENFISGNAELGYLPAVLKGTVQCTYRPAGTDGYDDAHANCISNRGDGQPQYGIVEAYTMIKCSSADCGVTSCPCNNNLWPVE